MQVALRPADGVPYRVGLHGLRRGRGGRGLRQERNDTRGVARLSRAGQRRKVQAPDREEKSLPEQASCRDLLESKITVS